jgi:hypothetical protein
MGVVMIMLPENQFGYLCLFDPIEETAIHVKANKITAIKHPLSGSPEEIKSVIFTDDDEMFYVGETVDKIFEQLENIHPTLR